MTRNSCWPWRSPIRPSPPGPSPSSSPAASPQRRWAKKPEQDHRFGAAPKALLFPGNLPSFQEPGHGWQGCPRIPTCRFLWNRPPRASLWWGGWHWLMPCPPPPADLVAGPRADLRQCQALRLHPRPLSVQPLLLPLLRHAGSQVHLLGRCQGPCPPAWPASLPPSRKEPQGRGAAW